jgi:hypothetical protein
MENVISYHNVASSEDQDIRDGLVDNAVVFVHMFLHLWKRNSQITHKIAASIS